MNSENESTSQTKLHKNIPREEENFQITYPLSNNLDTVQNTPPLIEDEILATLNSLPPIEPIRLTYLQKFAISSGHFLNDLCAALWFSYLLLYFQSVVGFDDKDNTTGSDDSKYAATLMLVGQLVDGIATPIVGYEVDHYNIVPLNYGRCKSWHLWGSIMVLSSFPFIFSPIIGGSVNTTAWVKMVYYSPFIAIFQIGWAAVQVSHLALIPKMHPDELVRTELFSIRYAFTVVASISVFVMTWIKLKFDEGSDKGKMCRVDKEDSYTFMTIALIGVGMGLVSSIFFHLVVKEETDTKVMEKVAAIKSRTDLIRRLSHIPEASDQSNENSSGLVRRQSTPSRHSYLGPTTDNALRDDDAESSSGLIEDTSVEKRRSRLENALAEIENETQISVTSKRSNLNTKTLSIGKEHMKVKDWFTLPQTYIVAFIYMATRLSINLGQVYIPLYVQESLRIPCTSVALIPLTMYISGFLVSIIIKLLNKYFGRQIAYTLGAALALIGSLLVLLLDWDGKYGGDTYILKTYIIYIVAVFLGAGASAILVTSLSITADLIGSNIDSGAFVYGSMSFCDKLSCGLAILLINSLVPCPGQIDTIPPNPCMDENIAFYRNVLGYSVGGCALLGVVGVVLLTYRIYQLNILRKREESALRRSELK